MLRCWAVIDDGAGVPDDAFAGALVLDLVCTIPEAINRQLGMMAPVYVSMAPGSQLSMTVLRLGTVVLSGSLSRARSAHQSIYRKALAALAVTGAPAPPPPPPLSRSC